MCGIAGYLYYDKNCPVLAEDLKRMTDIIAHRGPDGEGRFIDKNVALGHRRLAIIDLLTGHQPMKSQDDSLIIVFNGEIYNYIELRDELINKGYNFITKSDTEVILASYKEWGIGCVQKFNGMWAFALWDKNNERLFCSRDRVGEKPFYYSNYKNTFVFGSEIKSLFAYGIPRNINWEVLDVYLCFTYVPAPYTFLKDIYKLEPGHSLIIENGHVKKNLYWNVEFPPESEMRDDEQNIFEEFEALFYESVKIRMRSDVSFGAFLSGGLDSGTIVAVMSKYSEGPVKTCTIGFDHKEFDERDMARLVANKFQTDHVERIVDHEDAEALMQKLAWHYDEPFGDSSALPTYIVSRIAKERVKMVLSGDGGDEVLSGYTVHQGEKFSHQFSYIPGFIRKSVIPFGLNSLHAAASGSLKRKFLRAKSVVGSANMNFIDRLESKRTGFTRAERDIIISNKKNIRPAQEFIEEEIRPVANRNNFTKLNYWLIKVSLPDDILCKVDRASMAHGLEVRVPFLDHRIIELLATISMKVKLKGYSRKHILRKTLGKQLPGELLTARKKGFSVPLREWFNGQTNSALEHRSLQCANFDMIEKKSIEKIIQAHRSEKRDAAVALWSLGMLSYLVES